MLATIDKKTTVVLALNPLDRSTWETYQGDFLEILTKEIAPRLGGSFPSSGRIYHNSIDKEHDVTPATAEDIQHLEKLKGVVYVVVWPAAAAIAVQVGLIVVTSIVKYVLSTHGPDREIKAKRSNLGSPNNLPGQRQNTDRILQRIPDIYGIVKCTPDLIQYPYISYENNFQVETVAAVIGRGEYLVFDTQVFDGTTLVKNMPGSSLAIYPPHEVPLYGTPQLQIGPDIDQPLYNVVPVREVVGDQLLAPNNTFIFGEDDEPYEGKDLDDPANTFPYESTLFEYPSAGVGKITFSSANSGRTKSSGNAYFTDRLGIGDKFGLFWMGTPPIGVDLTYRGAVSVDSVDLVLGAGGDANIPDLHLLPDTSDDDNYEVTAVVSGGFTVEYTITVPASKQAEWAKIAAFNPAGVGGDAPAGTMYNRSCCVYVLNYRLGPFFCNDPTMEQVHLNFIAEKGLWVDDGTRQRAYGAPKVPITAPGGIQLIIELTPADENGTASGAKEIHDVFMVGSRTKRDFIGQTVVITPSFTGRFLVAVYRNTPQYWRTTPRSYYESRDGRTEENWREGPINISVDTPAYLPTPKAVMLASFADEIKWTHCYGMSEPKYYPFVDPVDDFGNVTIVHSKTAQVKFAGTSKEVVKNLNMIVNRIGFTWNGSAFTDTGSIVLNGRDVAFNVIKDQYLGAIGDDDQIDTDSIVNAFAEVGDAFGDPEATNFSHTFDSEQTSLEDFLAAIGDSCFVNFYRQGDVIKAVADVSRVNSTLLFNHRNKLPGSETRGIEFGTEEEFDGVEVEYSDNNDNQIKAYVAPLGILPPRNAQKVRVAGVRTKGKAAMQAWRMAYRLLHQKMTTEFDACEEAALALVTDKVLVADETKTDVQDGYITRIDGLTVYTSQEVNVGGSGQTFTLFIQDVDGSTQAIPVVTEDTAHSLILDGAPSATLVIDEDAGIFPRYFLVRDQDTVSSTFQIKQTQYKNRGVYSVTATNYTEAYYFYDALRLWVTFKSLPIFPPITKFMDRSYREHDATEVGTPTTVTDSLRGFVFQSLTGVDYLTYNFSYSPGVGYTIACWIKATAFGSVMCGSDSPSSRLVFSVNAGTGAFRLFHDSMLVCTGGLNVLNEWQHIGVTYDPDTGLAIMYLDGEEISTAVGVADLAGAITGLNIVNVVGRADDFRFYRRPKSAQFMRELYRKHVIV